MLGEVTTAKQKNKTFTDALLKGSVHEYKSRREEVPGVPLKPLANPKVVDGNVVVELDVE